jgi:hypothetical protein
MIGWVTGMILSFVLSYLIINLFIREETNLIVGFVVGFMVGLAQLIASRGRLPFSWRWIWGAAAGAGIPFVASTIVAGLTGRGEDYEWWFYLLGVAGGAIAGLVQYGVLVGRTVRPKCWIGASTISWTLAWLLTFFIGEAGIIFGGLLLGAVGGAMLVWRVKVKV